jgi:putative two-component system hydrogenase maturation factor HypX/HoxX
MRAAAAAADEAGGPRHRLAARRYATVLRKINAADGFPGVADSLFGQPCHIFDAWPEKAWRGAGGTAGEVSHGAKRRCCGAPSMVRSGSAMSSATGISSCRRRWLLPPSRRCCRSPLDGWWRVDHATWQDIAYEESNGVGFLHFEFYNGAMSTAQCRTPARRAGLGQAAPGQGDWSCWEAPTSGPMASTST